MNSGHFSGLIFCQPFHFASHFRWAAEFERLCYNMSRDCNISIVIFSLLKKRLSSEGIRP